MLYPGLRPEHGLLLGKWFRAVLRFDRGIDSHSLLELLLLGHK